MAKVGSTFRSTLIRVLPVKACAAESDAEWRAHMWHLALCVCVCLPLLHGPPSPNWMTSAQYPVCYQWDYTGMLTTGNLLSQGLTNSHFTTSRDSKVTHNGIDSVYTRERGRGWCFYAILRGAGFSPEVSPCSESQVELRFCAWLQIITAVTNLPRLWVVFVFAPVPQQKGTSAEFYSAGEQHIHDSCSTSWSQLDTLSLTQFSWVWDSLSETGKKIQQSED